MDKKHGTQKLRELIVENIWRREVQLLFNIKLLFQNQKKMEAISLE